MGFAPSEAQFDPCTAIGPTPPKSQISMKGQHPHRTDRAGIRWLAERRVRNVHRDGDVAPNGLHRRSDDWATGLFRLRALIYLRRASYKRRSVPSVQSGRPRP